MLMEKKMKTKEIVIKNFKWIALFICLVAFLAILEDVMELEIMELDIKGYEIISNHLISDSMTPIAKVITQFGSATGLVVLDRKSVV